MSFPISPTTGDDYTNSLGTVYTYRTDHWDITGRVYSNLIQGATGIQGSIGTTGSQGITGIAGVGSDGTNISFTDQGSISQHASPFGIGSMIHPNGKVYSLTAGVWQTPNDQTASLSSAVVVPVTATHNIHCVPGGNGIYQIGFCFCTSHGTATNSIEMVRILVDGTEAVRSTVWMQNAVYWNHKAERLIRLNSDSTVTMQIAMSVNESFSIYSTGSTITPVPLYMFRVDR